MRAAWDAVSMRLLISAIVNALALAAAASIVSGIHIGPVNDSDHSGSVMASYLFAGALFGVVNAALGKFIRIISIPLYCLTLGLFALVVNALLFELTAWLSNLTGLIVFSIDSFFWDGILGALIVSIVSALIGLTMRALRLGA